MPKYFTYTNLPEHQVAIYHDDDELLIDGSRPPTSTVSDKIVTVLFSLLLAVTFPISVFFCIKVLRDYEKAVIFRLGRLQKPKGPGVVFIIPCLDKWSRVDMRSRAFNVPPQKVHTKDDGWLTVGADIQFRLRDPVLSQTAIQNLNQSLRTLAQTALVNSLTTRTVLQSQSDRKFINIEVKESVNKMAAKWGAEVERVQLSDVTILKEAQDTGGVNIAQMFAGGQQSAVANLLNGLFPGLGGQLAMPAVNSSGESTPKRDSSVLAPSELVTLVQNVLDEELVSSIGGTYLFNITGENGGIWIMDLRTGSGSIRKTNTIEETDVALTMNDAEMINIFYGQVTPFNSYMQGGLKVEGDLQKAMNLEVIVEKLRGKKPAVSSTQKDTSGVFIV